MLWCYVVVSLGPKRGGVCYIIAANTRPILLQRKEVLSEDETSVASVYKTIWNVSRLKSLYLPQFALKTRADLRG